MQFGVMITNHGTHPPEKWAVRTAEMLTPIDPNIDPKREIAALKLRAAIADVLIPHHGKVQSTEKDHLARKGVNHLHDGLLPNGAVDASEHVEDAVDDIILCAKGTPWEEQFNQPGYRESIAGLVHSHFSTAMDIERQWHVDRHLATHGHDEKAIAYRTLRHPGPGAEPAPETVTEG